VMHESTKSDLAVVAATGLKSAAPSGTLLPANVAAIAAIFSRAADVAASSSVQRACFKGVQRKRLGQALQRRREPQPPVPSPASSLGRHSAVRRLRLQDAGWRGRIECREHIAGGDAFHPAFWSWRLSQ